MTVTVEQMPGKLKELLDRAKAGETVAIVSGGTEIARLVPPVPAPAAPPADGAKLQSLKAFRDSLQVRGESLSETVIRERREARY